jgi:Domain of unknown function (DUF929)
MRGRVIAMLLAGALGLAVGTRAAWAESPASIGKFQRVASPIVHKGGPATFFFMSALFCPYCAAERWAIVETLQRFGSWTNLGPSKSTGGIDGFAALPTYDFLRASYTSRYVDFTARDIADAQGHPLQKLDAAQRALVNRYDPKGGFPFLIIDGAYVQTDSGYPPGLLVDKTFAQVQSAIRHNTSLGRAIKQEADILTALLCIGDGGRPANVCGTAPVRSLIAQAG